jgi:hypothetical protein
MSKKVVKIEFEWHNQRDLKIKLNRLFNLISKGVEKYENVNEYRDHYMTFFQFYKEYRDFTETTKNGSFVQIVKSKIK